ncbi:MAG: AraC family transcriptional regulator [Christensenellaceae bacterium]|jgi:AraC family transcriptional regulator
MQAWETIQNSLDTIEANLAEAFTVEDLAEQAALSPFYYQRLFSKLVKKPLREYIKLRRLARASEALRDTDARILDIALLFGFSSHETFTKAFKAAYGITPEQFRKTRPMLNHFDKPDLSLLYTMVDEDVPLISEGLVLSFHRKTLDAPVSFMGISDYIPIAGQVTLGEETGIDLPGVTWNNFHATKHLIPRKENGREVGVAFYGDAPEGSFTYFTGAEVETGAEDARFQTWALPAGHYVICAFEAESFEELVTTAVNKAVKYGERWRAAHHLVMHAYSPEIYYPKGDEEIAYMELWMPVEAEK